MHKVAVVIPSYNHAAYIVSALESVVTQTLAPERIVVVDDGSTDNSLELLRAFAAAHPQLLLIPQANAGAHNALNRANAEAGAVAESPDDVADDPELLMRPDLGVRVGERGLAQAGTREAVGDWHRTGHRLDHDPDAFGSARDSPYRHREPRHCPKISN